MPRGHTVTKAQIARAISAARDAWGDDAKVTIHPDRTITIERGPPRQPPKPPLAAHRPFRL
jgi:hypothetical protein